MRALLGSILVLLALGLTAEPVLAHKVHIFAYLDDGTVYAECYFADGRPVVNAALRATDKSQSQVAAGSTDEQGRYAFPYTGGGDLRLELEASMGHRATFSLTIPKTGRP